MANTGVTATTYGTSTAVPTIAIDSKGRITSASNTNITFPVTTVNGFAGTVVLTTSDVAEGSNQYFTTARAQAAITGAASSVVTADLTASRALVSDGSGKIAASATTTTTEIGYLAGVTSALQTQLNGKLNLTGGTLTGGLSGTTGSFSGIITTPQVKAATSAGLSINANSGTQVADFGAGGSANITFFGGLSGTSGGFTGNMQADTFTAFGGNAIININNSNSNVDSRNWRLIPLAVDYGDLRLQVSSAQGLTPSINVLSFTRTGYATFGSTVQFGTTAGYTTASQGQFFSKGGGNIFIADLLASAATIKAIQIQRNDVEMFSIGLNASDSLAFINASGTAIANISSTGTVTAARIVVGGVGTSRILQVNTSGNDGIRIQTSGDNPTLDLMQTAAANAGARNWRIVTNWEGWGTLDFQSGTNNTNDPSTSRLSISGTTGTATFSSNLRVGGATGNFIIDSYTASKVGVRCHTDVAGITNNFLIQNSTNFNYGVFGVVSSNGTATGDIYGLGYTASAGTSMTSVLNWTSTGIVTLDNLLQVNSSLTSGKINIGALLNSGQNGINIQTYQSPGSGNFIQFLNLSGNSAGSITHTGTTTTAYNTSSDYRLKEDLKDFNGIDKIKAINVYDFKWKEEENRMFGVLAHELAEVLPYAVSGEKDAEYEDGRIKSQGVDYSFLTPLLVKAIQELTAKVEALEAK